MKNNIAIFLFLIGLISFIVYGNAVFNDFVWDDENLILEDPYVKNFNHFFDYFKIPLGYSSEGERVLVPTYRPIQSISYLVDYFLWGLQPFGFHLTNVILHTLVGLLFFLFVFAISKSLNFSFFVSAIYLVHPVNLGGVAYVSGRAEPLGGVFLLLSFLTYVKSKGKNGAILLIYLAISSFSYLLGVLSKEVILILPILFLAYDIYVEKKLNLLRLTPHLLVAVFYIIARFTLLRFTSFTTLVNPPPLSLRLIVCPNIILQYLRLLLLPFDLHLGYLIKKPHSFWQPEYFIPALILIPIGWFIFAKARRSKIIFFGFLWFCITLFPFLNIIFQLNAPIAEHWLYLPAMGFFIGLIGLLKERLIKSEKAANLFFIGLLIYFSIVTIFANRIWRDNKTMFRNVIRYSPGNFAAHLNLGVMYEREGKYKEALGEFDQALKLDPANENAKYHLDYATQQLKRAEGKK